MLFKFVDDYGSIILEAKRKAAEEPTKSEGLKILTSKQVLQRLPKAFAQVKTRKISENLLNEIRQIIYYLYWAKEITKSIP